MEVSWVMWVPLNHPFEIGIFHEIIKPAMGVPPWLWKPPYMSCMNCEIGHEKVSPEAKPSRFHNSADLFDRLSTGESQFIEMDDLLERFGPEPVAFFFVSRLDGVSPRKWCNKNCPRTGVYRWLRLAKLVGLKLQHVWWEIYRASFHNGFDQKTAFTQLIGLAHFLRVEGSSVHVKSGSSVHVRRLVVCARFCCVILSL